MAEEKPWLIVRYTFSDKEDGYKLREGDMLKFGKILFRVREIKILEEVYKRNSDRMKDKTTVNVQNADVSDNPNLGGTINIYHRALSNTANNMNNLVFNNKGDTLSNYSNDEERPGNLIIKSIK